MCETYIYYYPPIENQKFCMSSPDVFESLENINFNTSKFFKENTVKDFFMEKLGDDEDLLINNNVTI